MTKKGQHGESHIDPMQKRLEDDTRTLADEIKTMQEAVSAMRGPMAYMLTCSVDTAELWKKRGELLTKLAMLTELFPNSALPDDDEMQELCGAAKIF